MKGRKPGSKRVQDLANGTFRVIDGGGGPTDEGEDAAPAWITDRLARAEWRRLMPELRARKQYIPLFQIELGRYCVAFGMYVQALAAMDAEGGPVTKSSKKVPMLSQHWVVAGRAHEQMLRLAGELGLNPVSQQRLAGIQLDLFDQPRGTGTDGPGNPFQQFRRS